MLVKAQTERENAIKRVEAALKASAERDKARRRTVVGRKPRPLDISILIEMARITAVPDTDLEFFCFCIYSFVDTALGVAYRHKIWRGSDVKSSAKRIEAATRELEATINEASEGARERIRLCLPTPRAKSLDKYAKRATELAEAANVAGRLEHREPWINFRRLLISQFLSDVDRAGGRLTVSGEEGSLFEAFECLKPCLPEKFQISGGTLRQLWRRSRGSKRARTEPK